MNRGVLSNRDIESILGKDIFIYPFSPNNMRGGSTYNLTASEYAYYVDDTGKKHYCVEDGKIFIDPQVTVLIQTEESIYVSDKICGSYHSKVKLVSEGLSHIGTTLDPKYFGTSKIAIQNTSSTKKTIRVGDTFVSLMFYRLNRKALARHDNIPGRNDVLPVDIEILGGITDEQKQRLRKWAEQPWRQNYESLKDETLKNKANTTRGRKIKKLKFISNIIVAGFIGLIIILLIIEYFTGAIGFINKVVSNLTTLTITLAFLPLIIPIKDAIVKLIENNIKGEE